MKLVVKYRVPSLNKLFGMNFMARFRERRKAHLALWSALSPTDASFLTQTTSVQNRLLTAYGTLGLYLATSRTRSKYRSRKSAAKLAKSAPKSS